MTTPTKNAPYVTATSRGGQNLDTPERTSSEMNATTMADTWAISNNVTVTATGRGPAVLVTADMPLNMEETRCLVRDLLKAQRFVAGFFEPIPYLPA
ncbi:hypothetical protein [Corynebacterium riegelii]